MGIIETLLMKVIVGPVLYGLMIVVGASSALAAIVFLMVVTKRSGR